MKKGMIFVVSGPSGSGKGTIVRMLVREKGNMFLSTSLTTRGPRPGEVEGDHYYYVTEEYFKKLIRKKAFLEHARYATKDRYGTLKDPVVEALNEGKDVILEIDVQGAMKVQKQYPDTVLIMLTPTDSDCLERWLRSRNENDGAPEEKILQRLRRAKDEILFVPVYDYHVYNKEGRQSECVELIYSIMQYEHAVKDYVQGNRKKMSEELKRLYSIATPQRTKYKAEVLDEFK